MAQSLPAVHDDGARATSVGLVDFSEMVREKKVEAKLDNVLSPFLSPEPGDKVTTQIVPSKSFFGAKRGFLLAPPAPFL